MIADTGAVSGAQRHTLPAVTTRDRCGLKRSASKVHASSLSVGHGAGRKSLRRQDAGLHTPQAGSTFGPN
jgi:hypothetical protein